MASNEEQATRDESGKAGKTARLNADVYRLRDHAFKAGSEPEYCRECSLRRMFHRA